MNGCVLRQHRKWPAWQPTAAWSQMHGPLPNEELPQGSYHCLYRTKPPPKKQAKQVINATMPQAAKLARDGAVLTSATHHLALRNHGRVREHITQLPQQAPCWLCPQRIEQRGCSDCLPAALRLPASPPPPSPPPLQPSPIFSRQLFQEACYFPAA